MFPQVGLKFLENRGNPDAFEPPPWSIVEKPAAPPAPPPAERPAAAESYRVEVNGKAYDVRVSASGTVESVSSPPPAAAAPPEAAGPRQTIESPLAGNIVKVNVVAGQTVAAGDTVLVLEAMKMETEVRAPAPGTVAEIRVKEGDAVALGAPLLVLG
jgi:oxaloacetate decarboxylase alpha subunit